MLRRILIPLVLLFTMTHPPLTYSAPLKDASIKSGVWIGAAMDSGMPMEQQLDLKAHFTAVTSENAFKWGSMESIQGQIDFTQTDQMVKFTADNQLRFRAHTLFWHRMQNPLWLRNTIDSSADKKGKLFALMDSRIRDVVGRYKNQIDVWDVVNEPLRMDGKGWDLKDGPGGPANFFYLSGGEGYIDHAFRTTRQTDPRAKLFLNEYLSRPARGDTKSEALLALLKRLKSRNAPIDGVGLQMHGLGSVKSPFFSNSKRELVGYMKEVTKLGLRVEITELDISLPAVVNDFGTPGMSDNQHLNLQAVLYSNIASACAQVSGCSGITVWGLRDRDSWLNSFVPGGPHRPLLLVDDGSPKPSYEAVRSGILERCLRPKTKLCSEPWPNPQDRGVPYSGIRCNGCIRPSLKGNIIAINPTKWLWKRPVQRYEIRWMQSKRGADRGYQLIPSAKNKASFRVRPSQYQRWVKVCVRAGNQYGYSTWQCSSSRGPFRKN